LEEKSVRHWNRFFVVGTGRKKMKERKVGISYGMKTKRCDYGGLVIQVTMVKMSFP